MKKWNQDLVFAALAHPRRTIVVLDGARRRKTGSSLFGTSRQSFDAGLKQLAVLRKAGLVVVEQDPKDGRRFCYALSPQVPLQNTPEGKVLDFGFCLVRLNETDED